MSKITHDQLWKSIIEDFFEEFIAYFFPKYFDEIDFTKGVEFLEKELQTILAQSNSKNRRADKLVKVFKHSGEEEWLLIHIEVQGYKDEEFALRMFTSFYRIVDKYKKPVSAFVIYSDNDSEFHPKEFQLQCMDTSLLFKFGTYKLLEHPPLAQSTSKNPFSIIMEMAWYALDKNKLNDENQKEIMLDLVRRLFKEGYSKEKIARLAEFIKNFVRFDKRENKVKFEEEISVITKKLKPMGIFELVNQAREERGLERGLEKGLEKGRKEVLNILSLYRSGKSAEQIAKELEVPLERVEEIINYLKA